ncbi:hypothetical protein EIN_411410 [Entamoeba invadens IP1]|uniref:Uncharacterized protein n=1 Tax=Entamoeba invadens IP1 TaxID=370355 RepID=A0A0A1U184_ENTIV|nr:hypothetical protein EIN_411410 [Entamoeba invadens IP1]ELP87788.1 hypothetical protein EIN_411410 [Entamoeba invadens IP1]|eukprot:XP_004254559.1 hypothetical protein EIN_411410 [Entamoeba invadens IP1]
MFPGIISLQGNDAPQKIALKIRKRGFVSQNVYIFRKMTDQQGIEVNLDKAIDVTRQMKETANMTDLFDDRKHKIEEENQDGTQPIYYEFIEETTNLRDLSEYKMVIMEDKDLLNQSSDSFDSEDSNAENNPNNSYPDTPTSDSISNDSYSGDYYGDYYNDDKENDDASNESDSEERDTYDQQPGSKMEEIIGPSHAEEFNAQDTSPKMEEDSDSEITFNKKE